MKIINFLLRSFILLFAIFVSLSIFYYHNIANTLNCEGASPSTLDNLFWKIEEQREHVWHVLFRNVNIKYEVMMCTEDNDVKTSRFELREIGPHYPGLFRPDCLYDMTREEMIEFIGKNNQSYKIMDNNALLLTGSKDPNLVFVSKNYNNVADAAMEHFNEIQRGNYHPNAKNFINPNPHGKGTNVLNNIPNTFGTSKTNNWPTENISSVGNTNNLDNVKGTSTPKIGRGIRSPLDQFAINNWLTFSAPLIKLLILLTNIVFYLSVVALISVILTIIVLYYRRWKDNSWSVSQESITTSVFNVAISQINILKGQGFMPFMFYLFAYILLCNLIGMIPYTLAPTSHFALAFYISFSMVAGATILGCLRHNLSFFALFVPSNCPFGLLPLLVLIEVISYLARNISLGLRLAANILSGHMLLNILSEFTYNMLDSVWTYVFILAIPIMFIMGFSGLEIGIAFIQAQVFTVLSSSYTKDSVDLH